MNRRASQSSSSGWLGGSARKPKSLGVFTRPVAEMMLPDPIHHHARGERVLRAGDGAGQFEPSAAVLETVRRFGPEITPRNWRGISSPSRDGLPRLNTRGFGSDSRVDEDQRGGRAQGDQPAIHFALAVSTVLRRRRVGK